MIRAATTLLVVSVLAAPAAATAKGCYVTPRDGQAVHADYDIDANIKYRGDDLVFERGTREIGRITADSRLLLGGSPVALSSEQAKLVASYRENHETLMSEAKAVGIVGARIGARAAGRAVTAILSLGANAAQIEAEFEAEAAALEERAARLCIQVGVLREAHAALAEAVPAFGQAVPLNN